MVDLTRPGRSASRSSAPAPRRYFLEPFATTRVMVVDGRTASLVIAIEPSEESTLEEVLKHGSAGASAASASAEPTLDPGCRPRTLNRA